MVKGMADTYRTNVGNILIGYNQLQTVFFNVLKFGKLKIQKILSGFPATQQFSLNPIWYKQRSTFTDSSDLMRYHSSRGLKTVITRATFSGESWLTDNRKTKEHSN